MKLWLDPPLTLQEKRILAFILPPGCLMALLAGYAVGRAVFGL